MKTIIRGKSIKDKSTQVNKTSILKSENQKNRAWD